MEEWTDREPLPRLTRMEKIVLRLSAEGMTSQAIADRMFIARRTVDFHRHNLFCALKVHSVIQAILRCATITFPDELALPEDWEPVCPRRAGQDLGETGPSLRGCDTLAECAQRRKAGTPCCGACRERG